MKAKYALLPAVLVIVSALTVFGQYNHEGTTKADMKKHDMSSMMGKPTVDATVEGLHMKVWLMTQEQHRKMMEGKMGHMMMHGDMEDTMGHMAMSGMHDTSMQTGKGMKGMRHNGMGMNKAMVDSMMAGTHCIMLEVSDAATRKGISDASAKVMFVSPSEKRSTVDLKPMMSNFGSGLTLDEKGEYQFTISVDVNGVSKTKGFRYEVK